MMEWISVKDKLPEHGQCVLAYETYPPGTTVKVLALPLIGFAYQVTEYGTYGKGFVNKQSHKLKYVSHWMPLPYPPTILPEPANHIPDATKMVD